MVTIASKNGVNLLSPNTLGVVPYVSDVSPHVGIHAHGDLKQFLVFYRIVDSKQFLVTSLQLGIVIDNTTPTIHHNEHRS